MARASFDLAIVGGGLGGATLARLMAARGARVMVVERERRFSDRVRGEVLQPWGVAEARTLGISDLLRSRCAQELRWLDMFFGGMQVQHRDLVATTPQGAPWLSYYHPAMQETLLAAAAEAGAEVRRPARVRAVTPGSPPLVSVETDGTAEELSARLVVGADGRGSMVRKWAGFTTERDPDHFLFSGVLLEDVQAAGDTGQIYFNPDVGRQALLFPQPGGRVRAYVGYHPAADPPRGKALDLARFVAEAIRAGIPAATIEGARAVGPLAAFEAADSWVNHPYRDGVALIGDAAATSDPSWGQGMSLTLRDVRTFGEQLAATNDWDAAGHTWAAEHDRYYAPVHRVNGWIADLFLEMGPEAQARRERALPLIAQDPSRVPDVQFGGPELPADETARRRFFAEE
jgi:2-polyprenyl-6-methoxyphenol hydroxylase-like FAD-dependent oxidoreductase